MPFIGNHADHCQPRSRRRIGGANALSDRVWPQGIASGKLLIDDRHVALSQVLLLREPAPAQQSESHRVEVSVPGKGVQGASGAFSRLAFDLDAAEIERPNDGPAGK